ncbi:hypothetical protein QQP08_017644 [Theobroma cacao]|nr:hypothetical protein QQP08_017644 [Theobroma cacao]
MFVHFATKLGGRGWGSYDECRVKSYLNTLESLLTEKAWHGGGDRRGGRDDLFVYELVLICDIKIKT